MASQVTQWWRLHLPMQEMLETRVWSLALGRSLEKEMATHSSLLARIIPWTEDPGRLQSMGLQSRTQLSTDALGSHGCLKVKVKIAQSCPTLCDSMHYTVHGILQARILEWVAVSFSRGSSQPRNGTGSPTLQEDSLPAEPSGSRGCLLGAKCRAQGLVPWCRSSRPPTFTSWIPPRKPRPSWNKQPMKSRGVTDMYKENANKSRVNQEKHSREKQD